MANQIGITPRKSVVQVRFSGYGKALAYYNDSYDLQPGDLVYVSGKLEGQRGRVTEVNYNFKIKLSDYQRVIALVDTRVHGSFHMAGSHFVTFDNGALPVSQVRSWFLAPVKEEEEYASGSDDTSFLLSDLHGMGVSGAIAERGHNYYLENRVRYLCVDGTHGYAIVEGTEPYEVEFEYRNGAISSLTCSCWCNYHCKHEFAAMLQLREILNTIEKQYAQDYERTGYFAAVGKETLFEYAVAGKEDGELVL